MTYALCLCVIATKQVVRPFGRLVNFTFKWLSFVTVVGSWALPKTEKDKTKTSKCTTHRIATEIIIERFYKVSMTRRWPEDLESQSMRMCAQMYRNEAYFYWIFFLSFVSVFVYAMRLNTLFFSYCYFSKYTRLLIIFQLQFSLCPISFSTHLLHSYAGALADRNRQKHAKTRY